MSRTIILNWSTLPWVEEAYICGYGSWMMQEKGNRIKSLTENAESEPVSKDFFPQIGIGFHLLRKWGNTFWMNVYRRRVSLQEWFPCESSTRVMYNKNRWELLYKGQLLKSYLKTVVLWDQRYDDSLSSGVTHACFRGGKLARIVMANYFNIWLDISIPVNLRSNFIWISFKHVYIHFF